MIICVVGPTGSGKSKLAEKLADFYDGIIINFDAFQIYKKMNIGTAKPSITELKSGRYFLYDFVDPKEEFDVSKYQVICRDFINKNLDKNLILVGGTGLNLKAVLYDYKFENEEPMPSDYLSNVPNEELYKKLHSIDAIDAEKIGINNRKRLLRALYIYEIHGVSKTKLNNNGRNNILYNNVHILGLNYERDYLYNLINKRVDSMFDLGLQKEVEELLKEYGKDCKALQAIGYKEFIEYDDINTIRDIIKQHTRNYAKRQLSWFRADKNIHWF